MNRDAPQQPAFAAAKLAHTAGALAFTWAAVTAVGAVRSVASLNRRRLESPPAASACALAGRHQVVECTSEVRHANWRPMLVKGSMFGPKCESHALRFPPVGSPTDVKNAPAMAASCDTHG